MAPIIRALAYVVGLGGFGYVLMQIVTPDAKELSKVFPEAQEQYRSDSLKKKQALIDVLRSAAEGREPMYRQSREEIQEKIVGKK